MIVCLMALGTGLDIRSYRVAWAGLVIAIVALLVGLYTIKNDIVYAITFNSIAVVKCPDRIIKARAELLAESAASAPPMAGIRFEPSTTQPGQVDAYIAWINPSDMQESAIAISGVYGVPNSSDGWIDHTQPAGSSGQCWNWYSYGARNDAQPKTVALVLTGLWPKQKYCFWNMYKTTDGGWSKPSKETCKVAAWNQSWGVPKSP